MASIFNEQCITPQLLKLEEVLDETVKSGTTVQEELKPAILLRCVGGQLKSCLNLTIGDNVQYSTLREQVLQWARSQVKDDRLTILNCLTTGLVSAELTCWLTLACC